MIRIGFGFDTHRLADHHDFWLGGIRIDHEKGAVGHSDADVLVHAICDAMLGAAGLRDIGNQFPDSSPDFRGIDSKILLGKTCELIKERSFSVINIDSTIVLQSPRISNRVPEMVSRLSEVMGISEDQLSVKAKTSEKLGFIGREEGVSAYAVCLLQRV